MCCNHKLIGWMYANHAHGYDEGETEAKHTSCTTGVYWGNAVPA